MKKLVRIPSIEMKQTETEQQPNKTLEFEKILEILHNKGYKIVFHPSISVLAAWKQSATNFISFLILNYLGNATMESTEYKNSIQKIWNLLYEKPEVLLSDVKFRTLSFPFAGKIKIPYINNLPTPIKIHKIIFNSKLSSIEDNAIFIQDTKEFFKILEDIEKPKQTVSYVNLDDIWKNVVKSFMFLSFAWSSTTIASYLSLFPPISLAITASLLTISTLIFTIKKVRGTFTEIRKIFYYHEKWFSQNVQPPLPEDIVKYFNLAVEAFLDKDWLKFDSLAESMLNALSISSKVDQEVHDKIDMLNKVLSVDASLRNESTRFFILNELSKILKNLNILDFNVQEIFKGRLRPKVSKTTSLQQSEGKQQEIILETDKNKISEESLPEPTISTRLNEEKEIKSFKHAIRGDFSPYSDLASEETMGVMFHPTISSIEDFLKIFNKSFKEKILSEGEEEG